MKYLFCVLLIAALLCGSLSGCGEETGTIIPEEKKVTEQMYPFGPNTDDPVTEPPAETVPQIEQTLPPEAADKGTKCPYLRKVPFADQSIYGGPGYDFGFAGTVELAGTYTIVAEEWDQEGNLWGKLKSGAGWIDLTDVQYREDFPVPISANYADKRLLDSGNYEHYLSPDSEYAVKIAFRAGETLANVTFFSMEFVGENYEKGETLRRIGTMNPDKPFVAEVEFPGDMSMYGISFLDEVGAERCFLVYISGRNGALMLVEQEP